MAKSIRCDCSNRYTKPAKRHFSKTRGQCIHQKTTFIKNIIKPFESQSSLRSESSNPPAIYQLAPNLIIFFMHPSYQAVPSS